MKQKQALTIESMEESRSKPLLLNQWLYEP